PTRLPYTTSFRSGCGRSRGSDRGTPAASAAPTARESVADRAAGARRRGPPGDRSSADRHSRVRSAQVVVGEGDQTLESRGLLGQHATPGGGDPVVAASLVPFRLALARFLDQARFEETLDRAIERARTKPDRAMGHRFDVLHDR